MLRGSCLCQKIIYEIEGETRGAVYCHCSRCRKASGTAFASNASIEERQLRIVQGAEFLKAFSNPQGVHRIFCSECGSPIYSKRDDLPGIFRLRLGSLDTPPSNTPEKHIFVASKAEWHEITDALPRFSERPA